MRVEFDFKTIKDPQVTEALQRINSFLSRQILLNGEWKFFELTFSIAVDNFKYPHGLKFIPKDVIQTYISEDSAVIWNYNEFDRANLDITVSSPCTVRAFIGRYEEGSIV